MTRITYVEEDGAERAVDVKNGCSVMEGAVKNNVRGVDADCGGACACATCHIYVDESWQERLTPPQPIELAMLEFADGVQANSRLSCQIRVSDAVDGLVVTIPPKL